jgi:hypothetical protein
MQARISRLYALGDLGKKGGGGDSSLCGCRVFRPMPFFARNVVQRLVRAAADRSIAAGLMFSAQQRRLCAQNFVAWRDFKMRRADERGRAELLALRLALSRAGTVLRNWHVDAMRSRLVNTSATRFRLERLLRRVWEPWAAYAAKRRRARVFNQCAVRLTGALYSSRLRFAVYSWRIWTRGRRRAAGNAAVTISHCNAGLLHGVLSVWIAELRRRRAIDAARAMLGGRTTRCRNLAYLRRWRSASHIGHRIRSGFACLNAASDSRLRTETFRAWLSMASVLRSKRTGLSKLFATVSAFMLRSCLAEWATETAEAAADERRCVIAASHFRFGTLAASVAAWHFVLRRERRLASVHVRVTALVDRSRSATAFAAWRIRFMLAAEQSAQAERMHARTRGRLAANVLLEWSTVAHHRRKAASARRAAAAAVCRRMVRSAYDFWRAVLRSRLLQKAAVTQWTMTLQRRTFGGWRRYLRLQRLETGIKHRLELSALLAWRVRNRKAKQARLAGTLRRRHTSDAVAAWRRRLHSVVGARVLFESAVARLMRLTASGALARWKRYAFVQRLVRGRVALFRGAWVRQTFAALRAYAVHRRAKRERLWAARSAIAESCASE